MQFQEKNRIVYLYGSCIEQSNNIFSLNYVDDKTNKEVYLDVSAFRPNLKDYLQYSKKYKAIFYYDFTDLKYIIIGKVKFIYTR